MLNLVASLVPLLDKFIPDKNEQQKLAHNIAALAQKHAHELSVGQLEVNKEEAKHKSIFVAGWRPSVGWLCVVALGYHFVLQPFMLFVLSAFGLTLELPEFDLGELNTILIGMLGLSASRSFEKSKNVARSSLSE